MTAHNPNAQLIMFAQSSTRAWSIRVVEIYKRPFVAKIKVLFNKIRLQENNYRLFYSVL